MLIYVVDLNYNKKVMIIDGAITQSPLWKSVVSDIENSL
jgi:hypothetical protein